MKSIVRRMAAILLMLLPVSATGQELPFTHYTPQGEENGLPSAEVSKVFQDREGFIWFAVFSSGLVRYDGHRYELYTTADGLADLGVWDMIEDATGRLWVGSNAGLVASEHPLSRYAQGGRIRFTATLGATRLASTAINKNRIAVDRDGVVWSGTLGSGLIRYAPRDSSGVVADTIGTDLQRAGRNAVVRSIVVRGDGSVWVGIAGGDLVRFERGASTPALIPREAGVPTQNTNTLYETPTGILWGGCRDGTLWRLAETNDRPAITAVSSDLHSSISCITTAADGTLWVTSDGSGILHLDPSNHDARVVYTRPNGLVSDNVHHVALDVEGNLWFAQSGGASKLKPDFEAFRNFTAASGAGGAALPDPAINAILPETRHAHLEGTWMGTSEGGVACLRPDGSVVSLDTRQGLRSNWVNAVVFDQRGRLWIGTSSGINCLSAKAGTAPPPSPDRRVLDTPLGKVSLAGYRNTSVYSCYAAPLASAAGPRESVWFPGFHNLFCHVDDRWLVFREPSGLPTTSFNAVCLDPTGRLWVGTRDNGLYRSLVPMRADVLDTLRSTPVPFQDDGGPGTFGREVVTRLFELVWSKAQGAPTNEIDVILQNQGAMWVGTPAGLFVFEGEPPRQVGHVGRDAGLKANNITSMALSPAGTIWVGTNAGLAEVDPGARRATRTVTRQDGLVDNEAWFYGSVAVSPTGTVYFGTAKGLAVYSPSLDRPNPTPPRIRFRELRYSEDDRGHNQLVVEYAGLSFGNENRTRYRTRLAGYDRDWSPETADVKLRYTNLSAFFVPRRYVLEITACNEDGVWAQEPLRHTVSVRPPWWFRWWALALQLGVLGGTVYGIQSYRTRALEERNRQLEGVVDVRTQEVRAQARTLQEQNVELEQKNAEIMRTQQQLIVQEKLASLGQLTAGIAHEIRNPLNFVNNFAQLSDELVDELRADIQKHREKLPADTVSYIEEILGDLEQNLSRINEHGKRADGIVQGMLMHSRGHKGERAPTPLNTLLDEYAQLAYQGMRASDPTLGVVFDKHYDDDVGEVDVIPQDLSRVFLNIVNNACFAVHERKTKAPDGYLPTVTLATRDLGDQVEIRIRDNGTGMPAAVREKVFNPFFTTKPTGQGTGLGMSISYDIIVQEHKGTIRVESEPGSFTEFIIVLPRARARPL